MYKEHLLSNIEKEIAICKRLYTKIPEDQMNFRPKEGIRSIEELLQYLTIIGVSTPEYWIKYNDSDFNSFFVSKIQASKEISHQQFLIVMDKQRDEINNLFTLISEEDLHQKEIQYPWGDKGPLGEGIMATSVKFLTGYKLQLFLLIKLCTDLQLSTADAWVLTDIS